MYIKKNYNKTIKIMGIGSGHNEYTFRFAFLFTIEMFLFAFCINWVCSYILTRFKWKYNDNFLFWITQLNYKQMYKNRRFHSTQNQIDREKE